MVDELEERYPGFNGLNLSPREVAKMIPHEGSSSGQLGLLYEAISALRSETDVYTLEDIIEQVVRSNSKVKWNLVGQLESLLELGLVRARRGDGLVEGDDPGRRGGGRGRGGRRLGQGRRREEDEEREQSTVGESHSNLRAWMGSRREARRAG